MEVKKVYQVKDWTCLYYSVHGNSNGCIQNLKALKEVKSIAKSNSHLPC